MTGIPCGKRALLLRLVVACLGLAATNASALVSSQRATDPPIPILPLPPPFHFSDPGIDREYYRLQAAVRRAMDSGLPSYEAAHAALRPAIGARVGSPAWLRARDAIGRAIRDRRPHRQALRAFLYFLRTVRGRVPPAEAEFVDEFQRQAQEEITASSDRLLDMLALLAGIRIGQWPP